MKIILEIFSTILGVKMTKFHTFYSIYASKLPIWTKMMILTPKMVENIFEISCILTAAKNHTSYFLGTPFDPHYGTSSKESLMATSIKQHTNNNSNSFENFSSFAKNFISVQNAEMVIFTVQICEKFWPNLFIL